MVDVTSKSTDPGFVKFSPFFPLGGLDVPGLPGATSESVEGAWQGLKVFENEQEDTSKFAVRSMRNLKRTSRGNKRGAVVGHRFGGGVVGYLQARALIYKPLYDQALAKLGPELQLLRELARSHGGRLALLDYETNADINDPGRPLSHASLVAAHLQLPDGAAQEAEPPAASGAAN